MTSQNTSSSASPAGPVTPLEIRTESVALAPSHGYPFYITAKVYTCAALPHAADLDVLYGRAPPAAPLADGDLAALRELHADLVRICERARERGVKIIIDAEYRCAASQSR